MPIINMMSQQSDNFPEGAFSTLSDKVVLFTSHHGLCIADYEHNGHEDSDFYMIVWNEDKQAAEHIMFATTRGWSYPCMGSSPDATPEIMAKYNAWELARKRRNKIIKKVELRAMIKSDAKLVGLSYFEAKRLHATCDSYYESVLRLMGTKKFRSTFRASLAAQVREWLATDTPKHATPLSPRQMGFLY